jgi:peptidoglycan/LPS O-acetylase OafA/YrhL
VEPVLSWKPLILLSRITYTAFLCHGAIQIYTAATLRHPSYASIFTLGFYTAGDITLAYICALILSMFFEAPIIALEKIILRRGGDNDGEEKNKSPSPTEVTPKIKIINRF